MYPPHPEGKKSVLQVLRGAQNLQNAQKISGWRGYIPAKDFYINLGWQEVGLDMVGVGA